MREYYTLLDSKFPTEEELLKNAKEHGIKEHGYTEETWNEKMSKDQEKFKNRIKSS